MTDESDTPVYVPVRMPPNLVNKIDKLIEQGKYENRSHAIRTFARDGLNREDVPCNA